MIVVLDANAILADPHFKHSSWALLSRAIDDGTAVVFVPSVVVDEVKHHYPTLRDKVVSELEKQLRHLQGEARTLLSRAVELTRKHADEYVAKFEQTLLDLGFQTQGTPTIEHDEIARMALGRQRPFNDAGSGYRDALIWLSVLELIDEDPDDDYVLVSTDRKAFLDEAGQLHPDLVSQAEARLFDSGTIVLARSIGAIPIPDKYRGKPTSPPIHAELAEFVIEQVNSGQVESGELDPFDFRLPVDFVEYLTIDHLWIRDLIARELSGSKELEVQFTGDGIGIFVTSDFRSDGRRSSLQGSRTPLRIRVRGVMHTERRGTVMGRIEDFVVLPNDGVDGNQPPLSGLEIFEGS